jgi:hypothetical protein
MATPASAQPRIELPHSEYQRLLPFIDVMYSAVLSYGLYLFSEKLKPLFEGKPIDWSPLALLCFIMLYLVGDYIDARIYTDKFPYLHLSRFLIDLLISFAFFLAFVAGWASSPYALLCLAFVSLMGGIWVFFTYIEHFRKRPIRFLRLLIASHVAFAGVLVGHFYVTRSGPMTGHYVWTLWRDWGIIGGFYVFLEIVNNIPALEADLFPAFPIGRISRIIVHLFWPKRELPT